MKKFFAILLVLFLITPIGYARGQTNAPSSIQLENKVQEELYYFNPLPTFTVPGTLQTASNVYIYRMGDVIEGKISEPVSGQWIVALEKTDGTVIDQVTMSGGNRFSISTGNVPNDGKYKVVATDSLDTANQTWLISTFVYIKYNIKLTNTEIKPCPQKTNTISGYITRGNGESVKVPLTVNVVYPNGQLATSYSISANSSGQFTLTFPGTTDLWYYYIYISDGYPAVSPDNDAIVYAKIPNFSNITWTLKPVVMNPLLYDDENGTLNQSITLTLKDQDGKPVTGKSSYFYLGMGWTGYTVDEIAPGVYKIHGGTLKGGAIAIYVKQAIQSNIVTINLHKLTYFNPYIQIDAQYSASPFGSGPYYDYTLGENLYDKLPPANGYSFEAKIGFYPIPETPDPQNSHFTFKQDYFLYKGGLVSYTGVEMHKVGPDSSTVWNDPASHIITKPIYFVVNSSNVSFTAEGIVWKRANLTETNPWGNGEPDPLTACCVKKTSYTFKLYGSGAQNGSCNISVEPSKVTILKPQDLKVHVGNVNTIVHVFMLDKDGQKVHNAFTASYKGGREQKILDDLWYNPAHISGTNIPTLPITFGYDDYLDVKWVSGDVVFKNVAFNSITVCPHCPRHVIVEVFRADGNTHPMCGMIKDAVEVDPVIKELNASYKVVAQGGEETDTLLAGLRESIYVTVNFTYPDVNWFIYYNGKPIEDYGLHFNVVKVSDNTYKITFDKPLPFDKNYAPNKLEIDVCAVNGTKTASEKAVLVIGSKTLPKDTTPPEITITYPKDGALVNTTTIHIKGTVKDNIAVAELLVQNAETEFKDNGSFDVPVSLKEGKNVIKLSAIDASGNKTNVEITIMCDTTPPQLSVNAPSETHEKEVTVKGKTEADIMVSVNGKKLRAGDDGSFSVAVSLEEGENTITIVATDKAGNKTTKTITVTYKPQIIITLQPDNPMMTVNSVSQEIDPGRGTKPVIIPKWNRTVVPIRAIVEALGGTIEWDGTERKVTINLNDTVIELWIGKPQARVNGEMKWIDPNNHDVKPIIINSRTMLPLRFVAENLGCTVNWDPVTRTITITYTP